MKKIILILQELIKCSLIFVLCFVWLRFSSISLWFNITISIIVAFAFEIIMLVLNNINKSKKTLKTKEKEDAENMFLSLLNTQNPVNFFYDLVSTRHKKIIKTKDYIKISHQDKKSTILYPFIKYQKVLVDDIIQILKTTRKHNPNKIVIVCSEYENDVLNFAQNFDKEIVILNKYETYKLLYKEYEFFPQITVSQKAQAKYQLKEIIAFSFNKSKSKGYIFSALIIFIGATFTKMNLYYCTIASILVIFALVSFINPKYNIQTKKELL